MGTTVGVRGVQLAVEDVGAGVPVLWGHGLTSSMASEDAIGVMTPRLDEDRFRLVRYDARGHGGSAGTTEPADYAYPELARDQLGLADALGIDRFVSGGASLGCGTALHVAVRAPERVRALVLMIPPTAWEGRVGQGEVYEAGGRLVEAEGVEALIAVMEAEPVAPVFAPFAEQMKASVRPRYEQFDPAVLAALLRGVGPSDLPSREAIAAIASPALILAWRGDPVHPESTAEQLVDLLPDAEMVIADDLRGVLDWQDRIAAFLEVTGSGA